MTLALVIRYVFGDENIVANALSRVEELQFFMNYVALAASQNNETENISTTRMSFNLRRSKS